MAGVDPSTLKRWREDDLNFDALICTARLEFATNKLREIDAAGGRDWKASAYMLERLDETRSQFAQNVRGGGGGGNITVTIIDHLGRGFDSAGLSILR